MMREGGEAPAAQSHGAPPAPAVSVIIPTYERADLIAQTVGCVLAQTFSDLECIVVDDGSTDDTRSVVEGIADPRVRYVHQENSGMPAPPRNHGIRVARGRWLAFLDSDDLWYPMKLERCMGVLEPSAGEGEPGPYGDAGAGDAAETDGADLVCHDVAITKDCREVGRRSYSPDVDAMYDTLLFRGNMLSMSAVVARTDSVREAGGFSEDPGYRTVEDFDLWLRLARAGARFCFLNETLGEYVLHESNATVAIEAHHANLIRATDAHFMALAASGALPVGRAVRRRMHMRLGMVRALALAGHVGVAAANVGRLPGEALAAWRHYRRAA